MEKWISKEKWNRKCPRCGEQEWCCVDIDYETYIVDEGSFGEKVVCNNCKFEFTLEHTTVFSCMRYNEPGSPPLVDNDQTMGEQSTDRKMASIRKVLRTDNPDTERK